MGKEKPRRDTCKVSARLNGEGETEKRHLQGLPKRKPIRLWGIWPNQSRKTPLRPRNHLAVKSVPFTAVLVELGRRRDGRQEPAPNRDGLAPSHNPRSIPPALRVRARAGLSHNGGSRYDESTPANSRLSTSKQALHIRLKRLKNAKDESEIRRLTDELQRIVFHQQYRNAEN